jgi:myo-inositol-1(or 4)-monophosphatase
MLETFELLEIAKQAAKDGAKELFKTSLPLTDAEFDFKIPRELKSSADRIVENLILDRLIPTKIEILSEERGKITGENTDGMMWIIDPLDGTVNYVRELGPCSVSIALWRENCPIFGVICEYPSMKLFWGGPTIGAFSDGAPIEVSMNVDSNKGVLCSGFPSRFTFEAKPAQEFLNIAMNFAKVRMLGAASLSLIKVACGAADMYYENEIMIWDIAAGLAILEGAGGKFHLIPSTNEYAFQVHATNNKIEIE